MGIVIQIKDSTRLNKFIIILFIILVSINNGMTNSHQQFVEQRNNGFYQLKMKKTTDIQPSLLASFPSLITNESEVFPTINSWTAENFSEISIILAISGVYVGLNLTHTNESFSVFDFTAQNETNFNQMVKYLTNNYNDIIGAGETHMGSYGLSIAQERELLGGDPDLAGYRITFFRLIISSLLIEPEGIGTRIICDYNWEIWGYPIITVNSPGNELYQSKELSLTYYTYSVTSDVWYTLDTDPKTPITENTSLVLSEYGYHRLILWANDTSGYLAKIPINFKISEPEIPIKFNISLEFIILGMAELAMATVVIIFFTKIIKPKIKDFNTRLYWGAILMSLIFFSGQLVFINNVLGAGYIDNRTQYEYNYIDPSFDLEFDNATNLQNLEYVRTGSVYNDQLIIIARDQTQIDPNYYFIRINLSSKQEQLTVDSALQITPDNEIYNLIRDNRQNIVGNTTHIWLMEKQYGTDYPIKTNIITINLTNLSISNNVTTNFENLRKYDLTFNQQQNIFYQNNSIWFWDEYTPSQDDRKKNHFLEKISQDESLLLDKRELTTINCEYSQECALAEIFIENHSYWMKIDKIFSDTLEYWEYTWNGEQKSILRLKKSISDPQTPPGCSPEHTSEECKKIIYNGIWINEGNMYFIKTDVDRKILGVHITPIKPHQRPWPNIELGYWVVTSSIGIVGTILIWQKTKKMILLRQNDKKNPKN